MFTLWARAHRSVMLFSRMAHGRNSDKLYNRSFREARRVNGGLITKTDTALYVLHYRVNQICNAQFSALYRAQVNQLEHSLRVWIQDGHLCTLPFPSCAVLSDQQLYRPGLPRRPKGPLPSSSARRSTVTSRNSSKTPANHTTVGKTRAVSVCTVVVL